jgi:hypothetical protein
MITKIQKIQNMKNICNVLPFTPGLEPIKCGLLAQNHGTKIVSRILVHQLRNIYLNELGLRVTQQRSQIFFLTSAGKPQEVCKMRTWPIDISVAKQECLGVACH